MLTDAKIRSLKPKEKPYKLSDSHGLYILIHPNGSRYWRLKYKFNKKEKTYSIGLYPLFSLSEARIERDKAKKQIKQGIDPTTEKKRLQQTIQAQANNSFEIIAREWHNKTQAEWNDKHSQDVIKSLEDNIFPFIGSKAITEITPPEMLQVLRKIEARGALVQVNKLRQRCDRVFQYAIITGLATYNSAADLKGAFKKHDKKNFNSIQANELPELINAINKGKGELTTINGIKLTLYTLLRTQEVIGMKWSEVDFQNKLITIPASRMKMNRDHLVPLSRQATQVLKELLCVTGHHEWVFARQDRNKIKPMSNNAMLFALYRMGFKGRCTIHGFRSIGSTLLHEMGFNTDVIEKTLNHEPTNKVKAAYNKAQYLDFRADMLQQWADYLNNLDGKVIPIGINKNNLNF